jgi:hypothetical protein
LKLPIERRKVIYYEPISIWHTNHPIFTIPI